MNKHIVDRALELLLDHDMEGFSDLWAVDGIIEFPFAAVGYPQQIVGRETIREYMSGYSDILDVRELTSKTVHATADPDVAVAEFELAGIAPKTGNAYSMRYVAIITTDGSHIRNYRDYWSPLAAAEAIGTTDDLTAFAGGTA
ncbi:nuclear transport factor 2 family protein [Rhodococcus ruber]|uniref:Nuclear transport factor 2 family protein n=1 Tax=Rhodococcus ruber TaxID=1830 RepID=A0ABT4MED5_9NOCA|nr:nuclear transport factor 2 family protein [Rhodococcus ruber]MCZ4519352.1 nuclear transport factor 2 family protein [Rhodococcus ruber]